MGGGDRPHRRGRSNLGENANASDRSSRPRHPRDRHRLREAVLRREPPRRRARPRRVRGRRDQLLRPRPAGGALRPRACARGRRLRDRDARPPRPCRRRGRDDAAAAAREARRPPPRRAPHDRPAPALGGARPSTAKRCAATTARSFRWTRGARDRGPRRLQLELGGRPLRFLDTPGHARHHFCVWDEASRSMFTGDTFGLAYRELASDRGAS